MLRQSLFRLVTRSRDLELAGGVCPDVLADLAVGQEAVVDSLELPDGSAQRLLELGFIPGGRVVAAGSAPGGDPRVYRVDGAEVALRRETASRVKLRGPAAVMKAADAAGGASPLAAAAADVG